MKQLLFSIVIFSFLLIVGCQENSIVDPNAGPANKTTDTPFSGTIDLHASLDNPYPVFNSYFEIDGQISYEIRINYVDPVPPNPQQIITLSLDVNAGLNNICTVCLPPENQLPAGIISAGTNDVYNTSGDRRFSITKTFRVQKRNDSMVLKCTFLVSDNEISLDAAWLELQDQNLAGTGTE